MTAKGSFVSAIAKGVIAHSVGAPKGSRRCTLAVTGREQRSERGGVAALVGPCEQALCRGEGPGVPVRMR